MDQPDFAQSGYISCSDGLDDRTMTVLWYSKDALLERLDSQGASMKIAVVVTAPPYSPSNLENAARKILTNKSSLSKSSGVDIQGVIADAPDFRGLVVQATPVDIGTSGPTAISGASTSALKSGLAAITDIPVRLETVDSQITMTTSRTSDTPAFNAGGLMVKRYSSRAVIDGCSSGFAFRLGSTTYTSTARHCVQAPYYAYGNSATSYGTSHSVDNLTGWRLLNATGFYWMFDGPRVTSSHKTVTGYADPGINSVVFTSWGKLGNACQSPSEKPQFLDQRPVMWMSAANHQCDCRDDNGRSIRWRQRWASIRVPQ
jgi:hypothetical protein